MVATHTLYNSSCLKAPFGKPTKHNAYGHCKSNVFRLHQQLFFRYSNEDGVNESEKNRVVLYIFMFLYLLMPY